MEGPIFIALFRSQATLVRGGRVSQETQAIAQEPIDREIRDFGGQVNKAMSGALKPALR
jgi:hypothetical protein